MNVFDNWWTLVLQFITTKYWRVGTFPRKPRNTDHQANHQTPKRTLHMISLRFQTGNITTVSFMFNRTTFLIISVIWSHLWLIVLQITSKAYTKYYNTLAYLHRRLLFGVCFVPPSPKTFGARCILFSGVSASLSESASLCLPKSCEYYISKTNEWKFAQFWSQVLFGCWLDFGFKRSKVKVTAVGGITVNGSPLSFVYM